jgi:uncharacterized membrane protein
VSFDTIWTGTDASDWRELLFYLLAYSFGGWLLENGYSRITTGRWKEAFMMGPFKPMYGVAPVILLLFREQGISWGLLIVLCFIVPTVVEYVGGALLWRGFRRRWWDYSGFRSQVHGHICLPFSLCWGVLSLACLWGMHPGVRTLYTAVAPLWSLAAVPVFLYFLADLAWTVWSLRRNGDLSRA